MKETPKAMTKMDRFWLATATSLYPITASETLVTLERIRGKYEELFEEPLTPSLEQALISWKPRYADRKNPSQGGSRKRYFFRTDDGRNPSASGGFRLYKNSDSIFDGEDKTGPVCPKKNHVPPQFHYLIDWYEEKYYEPAANLDVETEHRFVIETNAEVELLTSNLPVTEKESLINARRGQGVFKKRVAEIESTCRLTGVTDIKFLVASHIKPWAASNNYERLDGHNGLLLAPHVDWLFDYGFITFKQDGAVVVSPAAEDVCQKWRLTTALKIPVTKRQEEYMQYHRDQIFRKKK